MNSGPVETMRDDDVLLTLAQKVAREHTAVLVIDVQNDFCATGGYFDRTLGRVAAIQAMIPRLQRFLGEARAAKVPVVFVAAGYDQASSANRERHLRRYGRVIPCCRSGTWGAEFYTVAPEPGELVIVKRRYSAFHATDLDVLLRNRGIRTVVVVGVATNVCVEAAARDAYMRDYYVIVVRDCTAGPDERLHDATLTNIDVNIGLVATADSLAAIWEGRVSDDSGR